MAGKKERAVFVCPQWGEVAGSAAVPASAGPAKVIETIKAGRPVARSALRRALVAASLSGGKPIDLDAYIVDQRTGPHRVGPRD